MIFYFILFCVGVTKFFSFACSLFWNGKENFVVVVDFFGKFDGGYFWECVAVFFSLVDYYLFFVLDLAENFESIGVD